MNRSPGKAGFEVRGTSNLFIARRKPRRDEASQQIAMRSIARREAH